jgi:hypothetical protein
MFLNLSEIYFTLLFYKLIKNSSYPPLAFFCVCLWQICNLFTFFTIWMCAHGYARCVLHSSSHIYRNSFNMCETFLSIYYKFSTTLFVSSHHCTADAFRLHRNDFVIFLLQIFTKPIFYFTKKRAQ